MRKKGTGKRLLALMMSAAMLTPSMSALASDAKSLGGVEQVYSEEAEREKEGTGREQVNFNRNWKFIRNDVEGAEAASYDDSSWVDVGIPHNFSIPYEMLAQKTKKY